MSQFVVPGHGQVFGEAHHWIVEAVHADAFCGLHIVVRVDVDINCVFAELVRIGLHCP